MVMSPGSLRPADNIPLTVTGWNCRSAKLGSALARLGGRRAGVAGDPRQHDPKRIVDPGAGDEGVVAPRDPVGELVHFGIKRIEQDNPAQAVADVAPMRDPSRRRVAA